MPTLYLWLSVSVAVLLLAIVHKSRSPKLISILPGPPSNSWLVGNIPDLERAKNVGDADFEWIEKYGTALRIKGVFGENIVYLADPKALHYISTTSGYNFYKPADQLDFGKLFTGKSIITVEGADHVRHRKIMNPAFAYTSLKGFLPMFTRTAAKAASKWRGRAIETGEASPVIDVAKWLPRLTLDVIGEAALNYEFGALDDNTDNELMAVYENLFTDTMYNPSNADIAFRAIWAYLPAWTYGALRFVPLSGMTRIRHFLTVAFGVAQRLVDNEVTAIINGKPPGKDAMSMLVRANHGENMKGKLSDQELLAEMTTLMIAGSETTSSTLGWLLYELSRHPDYQRKIREEIKLTRQSAAARGVECLSVNDFETMTYTVAAMKETLRFHPIGSHLVRIAGRDDTIPLLTPQRSRTGEMFTSVPVTKGQKILLSLLSYNRLKDLWGKDSHQWRPERFIEGNPIVEAHKTGFGVYANLATFASGVHGCIGWQFALLEMQAVMIELLDNLEFAPAPGVEIIGVPAMVVSTMVKGKTDQGTQLPLMVTPL